MDNLKIWTDVKLLKPQGSKHIDRSTEKPIASVLGENSHFPELGKQNVYYINKKNTLGFSWKFYFKPMISESYQQLYCPIDS